MEKTERRRVIQPVRTASAITVGTVRVHDEGNALRAAAKVKAGKPPEALLEFRRVPRSEMYDLILSAEPGHEVFVLSYLQELELTSLLGGVHVEIAGREGMLLGDARVQYRGIRRALRLLEDDNDVKYGDGYRICVLYNLDAIDQYLWALSKEELDVFVCGEETERLAMEARSETARRASSFLTDIFTLA